MKEMYVGLDVSKDRIVGVWKDKEGKESFEETFTTDEKGMNRLAERTVGVVGVAVEASTTGVYVYEFLLSKKVPVVMAAPSKIRLIAESDKKTDRNDAEILVDLLRLGILPTCYVPPKEVRELRDIVRHRKALVETVTVLKNKLRAILRREGKACPYKDLLGQKAMRWLNKAEVSPVQKDALNKLIVTADLIEKDIISDYNLKIHEAFESNKQAKLLDTMPGIDRLSAVTIMSEIGDISRFPSHQELASYAGLVPRVHQSGNVRHDGHIKPGSKIMRHMLVQDAWVAIRVSRQFRTFFQKIKRKKGKKVAIVAVARKMVKIMWFMLTREEEYLAEAPIRIRSARTSL